MNVNEMKYESLNHGDPLFALFAALTGASFESRSLSVSVGLWVHRLRISSMAGDIKSSAVNELIHFLASRNRSSTWSTVTISWRFMEHHGVQDMRQG
jgi:hypothetical protein